MAGDQCLDPFNKRIAQIRLYHSLSKHSPTGYAPSPGFLDWESQPDPFRRFVGCDRLTLPLAARTMLSPESITYQQLYRQIPPSQSVGLDSLGLLCELAWGLTAWKAADGARWSVRSLPSSGNLHPTESYLLLWDGGAECPPGIYHYDVFAHGLERRAALDPAQAAALQRAYPQHIGCVGLSSVVWREAWKYGARAFRYCQLDCGHAIASLAYAARVCGWSTCLETRLRDRDCVALFGLDDPRAYHDCEPEHPDCVLWLSRGALDGPPDDLAPLLALAGDCLLWEGQASRVSAETIAWPELALAQNAAVKEAALAPYVSSLRPEPEPSAGPDNGFPDNGLPATTVIRRRRSAQRMDPRQGMARADFSRLLRRLLPSSAGEWFAGAGFAYAPAVQILMMVHAVEGLEPGLYALNRIPERWDSWERGQGWRPVCSDLPLFCVQAPLDMRRTASQLSCYQGIAGRGAVTFAFVADMGRVLADEGAWAYRRLHWEAGLLGHVLYLEAESCGLRGTGIGCFMDDDSLALSGHSSGDCAQWQTVYHFTVGGAVDDARILTQPPYGHRDP